MKKRNFSAEFKRESAQLVVDQNYTVADAAKAMDIGLSTMTRWVKQLRDERQGKTPKASPITPEQIEIRELRKKLQRIEMENEILKKATALLMSDSLNSSRYVTNGAIVIHTQRLKSDPGGNLLS
ncbi:IS911 transposase [Escherichia coli]|nr:IS911 transposase [Escherichia coli]